MTSLRRWHFMLPLFFFLLLRASPIFSLTPKADSPPSHQAPLPHTMLLIGGNQLDVRIAANQASREKGLMEQASLADNEGMLFVFPTPQKVSFWMKKTPLPLSIAYMSSSGRILELHNLQPYDEHSVVSTSSSILYALEVRQGWFEEHHVLCGDSVEGLP